MDVVQRAQSRLSQASVRELEAARARLSTRIAAIRAGGASTPDSLAVNEGALRRVESELRRRGR